MAEITAVFPKSEQREAMAVNASVLAVARSRVWSWADC